MSIHRKLIRLSFVSLALIMISLPVSVTAQNSKTGKKKTQKKTTISPKTAKVEQSPENVELTTDDGNTVTLPAVNKTLAEQSSLSSTDDNLMADAGFVKSMASLNEQLTMKKEMEELSEVLGVHISDASLLDFYREVAGWLGTKYRRGGMSRKAVDCSGFTGLIYKTVFDQQIDRVSTVIAKNLKESVAKEDLLPGDMVFFSTFKKKYINHVGIYLGEGKFIHASIKKGVTVSRLDEGYYSKAYRKGGRN